MSTSVGGHSWVRKVLFDKALRVNEVLEAYRVVHIPGVSLLLRLDVWVLFIEFNHSRHVEITSGSSEEIPEKI